MTKDTAQPIASSPALRAATPPPIPAPELARAAAAPAAPGAASAGGAPPTDARADAPTAPSAEWPPASAGADLDELLARGLAGLFESGSLGAVAECVVQALSPLERGVLGGEERGVDPGPIRRAATMRLRVAEAISTAPPHGTPVDEAALSALLADVDALLAELSAAAPGAPAPAQRSLDAIREELVREALRLSETARAVADVAAAADAAAAVAARARSEAARTRVLSVSVGAPAAEDDRASHASRGLVAALALAIAATAAWHYTAYRARHVDADPLPTVAGAPARAFAVGAGDGSFVVQSANTRFAPGELDALREAQTALGNTVEEVGPGVALVRPGSAAAQGR